MKYSMKAEGLQASVTLAITSKAARLRSEGKDVVSFGAGEPDFNTPMNIIKAANQAMIDGHTKYTETAGMLKLREAICKKFKEDNNLEYNPSQIVVSTGAKQSLWNIFSAILNPEDEVIVPLPYWVSYTELIGICGGVPVILHTNKEDNFKINKEDLYKLVTSKTKAIIINSPNNPSGKVYSREELEIIAEFAKEHDLVIISDEIYEMINYDEKVESIATLSKDAYERTVVVNGFSKTYAMTGWRIGYTASCAKVASLMVKLQSHCTSNPNSIAQVAAIEALNGPKEDLNKMIEEFKRRRDFICSKLDSLENIKYIKPNGAFYILVDISYYFNKTVNGIKIGNAIEFASALVDEECVAVVPGDAFGLPECVRLSYPISLEQIEKGILRISNFLSKFSDN